MVQYVFTSALRLCFPDVRQKSQKIAEDDGDDKTCMDRDIGNRLLAALASQICPQN